MPEVKPKLLIVEDDPGLQAQLKWAWPDFEVVIAGDKASAIAALRSEEPPVVTLDLGLPPDPDGTSEGFAVLDAIMALKPDTKVIVASGHGARSSALQAIAKGAYDFYQKPVDIEALGLIVRRALQLHQIEAENRKFAARGSEGFTVIARVEALIAGLGQAEAMRRASAYVEAGADAILIHSKQKTPDEILEFVRAWKGPVPLVLVPTAYPQLTERDIAALGKVGLVIYGNHAIRAAVGAMQSVFAQIRRDGGIAAVDATLPSVKDIIDLQGDARMRELEKKYLR